MFQKILLATDGSPCSVQAARRATQISAAFAAQLTVLYVSAPYSHLNEEEYKEFNVKANLEANKAFEAIQASFGLIDTKYLFRIGPDIAETILQVSEEFGCDLIVLGSHGYSGLNKLILGSVANKVLSGAQCCVLVAKPD